MKKPKVIAVDFDGTLCEHHHDQITYVPKTEIQRKPKHDVLKFLQRLDRKKFKIIVYSSRWWGDYNWVKQWLDRNKVPYDDIILGRFKADIYIDDFTVNPTLAKWKQDFRKLAS